jgi:tyrosyl-tRNA synthetase
LCVLKRLQKAGHKVHALIGSITGLIGDPKQTEERKMQAKEQIEENVKLLSIQLKKLTGLEKI